MKTYKRELSIALLVWLIYLTETKDVELVKVLAYPIFTFAALSYGLDWFGKLQQPSTKIPYRWGSQRSSQYTNREDEQSDSRSKQRGRAEDRQP